jgi:hypothetical protein
MSFFFRFALSDSGRYRIPILPDKAKSVEYVLTWPLTPQPEVFGLHENADISKNTKETNSVSICQNLTTDLHSHTQLHGLSF